MVSFNKFLIPAAVGASLLLAACGSSSQKTSSSPAASAPSSTQPASTKTASLTIGTASGPMGTYLTGASGRALYLWAADSNGKSSCSGTCAKAWPPLMASSMPKATGGASSADLTLITRSDGTKQVAYKGHPLYYFIADRSAGAVKGQGTNGFGAKWWLVNPSGSPITKGSSSGGGAYGASSSSSSSGSSSSSSGSGWG